MLILEKNIALLEDSDPGAGSSTASSDSSDGPSWLALMRSTAAGRTQILQEKATAPLFIIALYPAGIAEVQLMPSEQFSSLQHSIVQRQGDIQYGDLSTSRAIEESFTFGERAEDFLKGPGNGGCRGGFPDALPALLVLVPLQHLLLLAPAAQQVCAMQLRVSSVCVPPCSTICKNRCITQALRHVRWK